MVADATEIDCIKYSGVTFLKTGRKHDKYGSAAINMGAYACSTQYFCLLDDDDEFISGAGEYMSNKVISSPEVDIWIPGISFNNGMQLCTNPNMGIAIGNVALPTYKTELLFDLPFHRNLSRGDQNFVDYNHINALHNLGYIIKWYEKVLYNIRPKLYGTNGRGV